MVKVSNLFFHHHNLGDQGYFVETFLFKKRTAPHTLRPLATLVESGCGEHPDATKPIERAVDNSNRVICGGFVLIFNFMYCT